MNRRDFILTSGAAALACGTIAAGGEVEAREEERGVELKVGDEVVYVGPNQALGLGPHYVVNPNVNDEVWVRDYSHWVWSVPMSVLARVLPGPLEVEDRIICVSNNSNWLGTPPAIGQKGTVKAWLFGVVRKAVHFDEDPPKNVWFIPDNPPDLVKIQELS